MGLDHECSHNWCFTFCTVFGVNVTGQVTVTVIVYRVPDLLSCTVYPVSGSCTRICVPRLSLIIIGARRMSTRDTISVVGPRCSVHAFSLRVCASACPFSLSR